MVVMLPLIPLPLREAVSRLLHIDPDKRPSAHVLSMIKYFQYVMHRLHTVKVKEVVAVFKIFHRIFSFL